MFWNIPTSDYVEYLLGDECMFTLQRQAATSVILGIALACAIVAQAQAALTGKWQGETPNGAVLVLDLAVKGTALTGTLTRNGVSAPITEGTVTKTQFTFKAKVSDQPEGFSGELADDQVKVWLDRQGPSNAVVLKRVKTADG
jgi:hypothetical protein